MDVHIARKGVKRVTFVDVESVLPTESVLWVSPIYSDHY